LDALHLQSSFDAEYSPAVDPKDKDNVEKIELGAFRSRCPLLAQSGHASRAPQCPLLGV